MQKKAKKKVPGTTRVGTGDQTEQRMILTHIKIQNYKSLKDFSLDLSPFMVFVGRNNVGKSNIIDCLQFLSDFVVNGDKAVKERGGFQDIVFNRDFTNTIHIELSMDIASNQSPKRKQCEYIIELESDRHGHCFNKKETFSLLGKKKKTLLEFPVHGHGTAILRDETGEQISEVGHSGPGSFLYPFSDRERSPILADFSSELEKWKNFNLAPQLMTESYQVQTGLRLQSFGQNVASVLHTLQTGYPREFKEIEEILRFAIPEIEELTTGLTDHAVPQTYIRVKEKHFSKPTPSWAISDGVLRLLGILTAVYSPEFPSLACFEEPENYIYPKALQLIVDLLKSASEQMQVLVTTHSPLIVDYLKPEDLYLVTKETGETRVKRAKDKKGIREALRTLGLGEMWRSGSLNKIP
jgi:predicted ATPase